MFAGFRLYKIAAFCVLVVTSREARPKVSAVVDDALRTAEGDDGPAYVMVRLEVSLWSFPLSSRS